MPSEGDQWYFESMPNEWQPFSPDVNRKILVTLRLGEKRLVYAHRGETYEVDLDNGMLTNFNTFIRRRVRKGATPGAPGHRHEPRTSSGASSRPPDVGVTAPSRPRERSPAGPKPTAEADGASRHGGFRVNGEWQWEESPGSWRSFDEDVSRILITARTLGKEQVIFGVGPQHYQADLEACTQKNLHTGFVRNIRWARRRRSPENVRFQWQLKNGVWVDYEEEENDLLNKAYRAKEKSVTYSARGFDYEVNLVSMEQQNISKGPAFSMTNASGPGSIRKVRIVGTDLSSDDRRPTVCKTPGGDKRGRGSDSDATRGEARDRARSPPAGHGDAHVGADHRKPSDAGAGAAHGVGAPRRSGEPRMAAGPPFTRAFDSAYAGERPSYGPRTSGTTSGGAGKDSSKIKLPKGVDWPAEPRARKIAEEVFVEMSAVPINERKKAFRTMVLKWHPDKNLDDEDTATDVFQFVQAIKDWYLGE